MARRTMKKGRMNKEDEEKIQRCTALIESEVEARDLTSHLFSAAILDFNDRSEIDSGYKRILRIKNLLQILMMRGPEAYYEFTMALLREGYENVYNKLENCSERSVESKLSRIEDVLNELCARVEVLESGNDIPKDQIADLKRQLNNLKTDNMTQIQDLIEENCKKDKLNSRKDKRIAELTAQLEEKEQKLQKAQERIRKLEGRLEELEDQCKGYRQDITYLKEQEMIQADRLQRQEGISKGLEDQCTSYKQDIDHLKNQEMIQADRLQRQEGISKDLEDQCTSYKQDIDHLKKQEMIQADRLKRQEKDSISYKQDIDDLKKQEMIKTQRQQKHEETMNAMMSKMANAFDVMQSSNNGGGFHVIGTRMSKNKIRVKSRWN